MKATILRWTIYLLALLMFGPLAGWLTGVLRSTDGGPYATPLVCSTPAAGVVAGLAAIGIALAIGLVTAILLGSPAGFTSAGFVLAWAAWRTGEVNELIRSAHSSSPLASLSLEAVIFGIVAMVVATAISVAGRRQPNEPTTRIVNSKPWPVLGAGFVAAAIGAWIVAVTPLKGQAVAAAIAAAVFAAVAGRLTDPDAPLPLLVAPVLLLGVLAPWTGFITRGGNDVVHAAYAGMLFPTANVLPFDYIAGAFLGVPLGVSWAASMSTGRIGP